MATSRSFDRGVRAKLSIRIVPQHHKRPKLIKQAFNTDRLLSTKHNHKFQSNLDDKFEAIGPLTGGPEEKWNQFKEVVTQTAQTVLGPKEKLHQDCFDDNDEAVQILLDEKRKAYTDWQNRPNCPSRSDRCRDRQARAQRASQHARQMLGAES